MCLHKHLAQTGPLLKLCVRQPAPVVEVAGDDQGRLVGNVPLDHLAQAFDLLAPVRLQQSQMHTNGVNIRPLAGHVQHTMQQTPALRAAH